MYRREQMLIFTFLQRMCPKMDKWLFVVNVIVKPAVISLSFCKRLSEVNSQRFLGHRYENYALKLKIETTYHINLPA